MPSASCLPRPSLPFQVTEYRPAACLPWARVRTHLESLDRTAAAAQGRFGRGRVMDHPILGPFTVDQWLKFHRIHTRHHQKQIVERRKRLEAGA